jgi:type-F conjugative transfer system pilin assembly protein TrbC
MLPFIKNVCIAGLMVVSAFATSSHSTVSVASVPVGTNAKPDLQKIYNEALTWSKTTLVEMPTIEQAHQTSGIGVCHGAKEGEPLPIAPPCKKKPALERVLDSVVSEKLLVFVSFSMPKASLKALAMEAVKHNAVLVMQGLKDDSFKVTQQAFLDLTDDGQTFDSHKAEVATQNGLQGFEVNPELFKTYKITKVPVFVLVKDTREISRLSGNVTLKFAAQKLKEGL